MDDGTCRLANPDYLLAFCVDVAARLQPTVGLPTVAGSKIGQRIGQEVWLLA